MSTLILLRHGHSAANATGTLTGQLPGVGLSKSGSKQAELLIDRIGRSIVHRVHVSPIERCHLTIGPWLRSKNAKELERFEIVDGLTEIDFGDWSGRKLSSLRRDPLWRQIQNTPSKVTFPNGESFKKAQRRAVKATDEIISSRGNKVHLLVSHSDTIKLILTHYLELPLDSFQKLQINPASFSIINTHKGNISVNTINNSGSLKELLG